MQLSDYEKKSIEKFHEACHNGQWTDKGLSEILKLISDYSNARTLNKFCKSSGLNYNTVKAQAVEFGGVKFVLDNE
jgi:hypothetical protein